MFKLPDWTRIWLRGWLKFVAYVAALWAAFRFIFDFSNQHALGLGLVIAVASDLAASGKGPTSATFRPHLIGIYPHLGLMLLDTGVITQDELQEATKDIPPFRPWTDQHLFHYAIRAFVISWNPNTRITSTTSAKCA